MLSIELQLLRFMRKARGLTPAEQDFGVDVTIDRDGHVRRADEGERSWTVDPAWLRARHAIGLGRVLLTIGAEMREHLQRLSR